MALIINIDTSMETGSVSLANQGIELAKAINREQRDHASWLHEAIRFVLDENDSEPGDLQAVAVTAGPGSYTGIRVGMASAKGLAYALSIPLITENTLKVMAWSQQQVQLKAGLADPGDATHELFCPMIDARRDEVFTGLYDAELGEISSPMALRLEENSFSEELSKYQVNFFGNGSDKWKRLTDHKNARFLPWDYAYFNLAYLAYHSYTVGAFADLAYILPNYLKEVYTYKKN